MMTTTAILTMVVVCGAVWGGLAVLVLYAIRREKRREPEPEESAS